VDLAGAWLGRHAAVRTVAAAAVAAAAAVVAAVPTLSPTRSGIVYLEIMHYLEIISCFFLVYQLGLTVRNRSVEGVLNRVPGGVGAHRTSRDKGSSEGCPGLDRPSTDQLLMCEDERSFLYINFPSTFKQM